ncbi:MAG: hypothetical protein IT303_01495 [Dehalococcoidia bacterium]|nr:hypothetical protein [Dehalococcoidia bacterium]
MGIDAARTAGAATPPLPARWPTTVQLGVSDSPGGAAALKAATGAGFRYQYLAGGVNTGSGWATWNTGGEFVRYYIEDSVANGIVPVFTYYQIRQSAPGNNQGEVDGVLGNLQNAGTMASYYSDLRLFFQKAAAFPSQLVVLHVEPDLWGFGQQRASGDNAATVPAVVGSSGLPELAGLPNNLAGVAQAVVRLRDRYAPNVAIGYGLSTWGTGVDPAASNPSNETIDALARRSAAFYASLGAGFDVTFAEFADRDAGFYQHVYGDGSRWWDAADFARNVRYLSVFSSQTARPIVMWQIPLGNTKMRAQNNTWGHYQDNRVEWLLDDPGRANLRAYADAGVDAFLFGGGASGTTCACDAMGDGVTNPAAINGNTAVSLNADDDGGYFKARAKAYYSAGAMPVGGGGSVPTPTPTVSTPTPTRTATATPTPTGTATSTPPPTVTVPAAWSSSATAGTTSVRRGGTVAISAAVRAPAAGTVLVDIEVYDSSGRKVYQRYYDGQSFTAGQSRTFQASWRVPLSARTGNYTVKVGVFTAGWGSVLHWNNAAATFSVR